MVRLDAEDPEDQCLSRSGISLDETNPLLFDE
jgi:hypothetical protein